MICVAGKNNIAVECLEFLLESFEKKDLCVCLNKTDDFQNSWQKSLGFYARKHQIKIVELKDLYELEDLYLFSLEFDRIIKTEKFLSNNLFNMHFSLLPKGKGMYTAVVPILMGESHTGVTLHKIDPGIDTGNIIDQIEIELHEDTTARELYDLLLDGGTQLFRDDVHNILSGNYTEKRQNSKESTYYSKSFINFGEIKVDFKATAHQIKNYIQAFTFRDYQLLEVNGKKINKCVISENRSTQKPGTLISEDQQRFVFNSIDYDVVLYKDYYDDLWSLIEQGKQDEIDQIISLIPDISVKDKSGLDAFLMSAKHNNLSLVKYFISKGAEINSIDYQQNNALMICLDEHGDKADRALINYLISKNINLDLTNDKEIDGNSYLKEYHIEIENLLDD